MLNPREPGPEEFDPGKFKDKIDRDLVFRINAGPQPIFLKVGYYGPNLVEVDGAETTMARAAYMSEQEQYYRNRRLHVRRDDANSTITSFLWIEELQELISNQEVSKIRDGYDSTTN